MDETAARLIARSRVRSVIRFIGHVLAALGLLVMIATLTPLDSWWAGRLAGSWDDPKGDVLIVLGGSILDDGQIGGSSYWRCIYAAKAYAEGFRQVIVTGGGSEATPIAVPMRDFLIALGVPAASISIETRSKSTRENALFSKPLLAGTTTPPVLLTSEYHMFRAQRTFRKAGIEVIPRPYPDIKKRARSWRGRWPGFLDLAEETAKIVYYKARSWI